ncbi:hypothetical protein BGZ83_005037, partial [Gryganskiella cystojenkinii]
GLVHSLGVTLTGGHGWSDSSEPGQLKDLYMSRERIAPKLAHSLDQTLDLNYRKSDNILHFDGPATIQKRFAHSRRMNSAKKAKEQFWYNHKAVSDRLDILEGKPHLSNGQLSRIGSKVRKVLSPSWKAARKVDQATVSTLSELLKNNHGWDSHVCNGQMDLCVAQAAVNDKNITAISADSDLLFTGIKKLIRFKPKGHAFIEYP